MFLLHDQTNTACFFPSILLRKLIFIAKQVTFFNLVFIAEIQLHTTILVFIEHNSKFFYYNYLSIYLSIHTILT